MPLNSKTVILATISSAFFTFSTQSNAATNHSNHLTLSKETCSAPKSDKNKTNAEQTQASEDPNALPINVEADKLTIKKDKKAVYSGHVSVTQGNRSLKANTVTLDQQVNTISAEGSVVFSNGVFEGMSDKATHKINSDQMSLENTTYKFLCQPGRGHAVYISQTGKAVYQIEDGSITSCPDGDNSWRMVASDISIDQNTETATFYNPRFEIQKVPIVYLPWLSMPIGNNRKTGFLYPTVAYGSSDGYQFDIPIYFNLHPQLDLTTHVHHMSKRGTQLNNNFRYLSAYGAGEIDLEYLNHDKKYPEDGKRWAFHYTHSGIINTSWLVNIDYAKASDIDYFTEFNSNIGTREEGQLIQQARATYRSDHWDMGVLARSFQLLTDSNNPPYQLLPQLSFTYRGPSLFNYLDFQVNSSVSRFETKDKTRPSATRINVVPEFSLPIANTWGQWTTQVKLFNTYYEQDLNKDIIGIPGPDNVYRNLESQVYRFIPQLSSEIGVTFDRPAYFLDGYTQTFEPKIQYLFVPNKTQNNIAWYDTTLLQVEYYGLFRPRRYSGLDYIAPENQISYGTTTRLFDAGFKERLSLSFGQIFYMDKSFKSISPFDTATKLPRSNYSAWAVEADFNITDNWFYHGGIQYDVDSRDVQVGSNTLEYRFDKGFIQTNYRYVSKQYIDNTVTFDTKGITDTGISQLGLLSSYKITPKWSVSGQYFYDFTIDKKIEWATKLTYTSDCWYLGLNYSMQLNNWTPSFQNYPNAKPVYEDNFGINFGITGFGSKKGTESGMYSSQPKNTTLVYGRPFFLNN